MMISPQNRPNGYRRAVRSLKNIFAGVLVLSAVINVLMLTSSIYMLQVYDRVLSSGSVPTLMALFAIVVVLYAFLAVFDILRARFLSRSALLLDSSIGDTAFYGWLHSGTADAAARQSGQTLQDLATVRAFATSPAMTTLFDIPFVPLYFATLFILHPWLGAATVAGAGVSAVIAVLNGQLTGKAIKASTASDQTERTFADSIRRNGDAVLAMGMQRAVTARWRQLHDATLTETQSGSEPSDIFASTSRSFRMLLQSAILTLGAFLVLRGEITAGSIIAASILSGRALAPLDQFIGQWRVIRRASAAHRRLRADHCAPEVTPPLVLPRPTGQITVTGLGKQRPARIGADAGAILSDVTFTLAAGDGLGVIGSSASGKSTLARLLVGVAQADTGEIRLDGATPDQWDRVVLGRHVGYLPQVVDLMPGTIRDNIARFDPIVSDAEILAAAHLTGVHDMILALPEGYATLVGQRDKAAPLSGGQIQRIGLTRAICRMPSLIVLDEPNSNLDLQGEEALTRTIRSLREGGSTVIVMAHRPSALAAVNKLMILEAGKIRLFDDKDTVLSESYRHARDAAAVQAPALVAKMPTETWAERRAARVQAKTKLSPQQDDASGAGHLPGVSGPLPVPAIVPASPSAQPVVRNAGPQTRKLSA